MGYPAAVARTPTEYRAEATLWRSRAKEFRERADLAEKMAELSEQQAKLLEAGLTIAHDSGTTETHMHVESAGAKRSAGQFTEAQQRHPFVAMLVRRKLAVSDIAERLKVPRTTVQAWYKDKDDDGYRAIPEHAAKVLKEEYAVPLSAWPRVRGAK